MICEFEMGKSQAAAALWHVLFQGSYLTPKGALCTVNKSSFAKLLAKVLSGQLCGFVFSFVAIIKVLWLWLKAYQFFQLGAAPACNINSDSKQPLVLNRQNIYTEWCFPYLGQLLSDGISGRHSQVAVIKGGTKLFTPFSAGAELVVRKKIEHLVALMRSEQSLDCGAWAQLL